MEFSFFFLPYEDVAFADEALEQHWMIPLQHIITNIYQVDG
jgi:hypothetical protein